MDNISIEQSSNYAAHIYHISYFTQNLVTDPPYQLRARRISRWGQDGFNSAFDGIRYASESTCAAKTTSTSDGLLKLLHNSDLRSDDLTEL